MVRVAADGRKGYSGGEPSMEAQRSFRQRHLEITFIAQEPKETSNQNSERREQVQSFFDIINGIGQKFLGVLQNPHRIWNIDETAVDATYGKREKVFNTAGSHNGWFKRCFTSYSSSKHITAVVCISASDLKAPPFFINAVKRINNKFLDDVKGKRRIALCLAGCVVDSA